MNRRSGFITFLTALIPGVGYMYLGLMRKGIEALAIFLLTETVFDMLNLSGLGSLIKTIIWFYTFIDTFNIAKRMSYGEFVPDSDFIIGRFFDMSNSKNENYSKDFNYNDNEGVNGESKYEPVNFSLGNKGWSTIAWILIIIGCVSIFNKLFSGYDFYYMIKSHISMYFLPTAFIIAGLYLLLRKK